MKLRVMHSISLIPALIVLLLWVVIGPIIHQLYGVTALFFSAIITAPVVAYSLTLFVHALRRDLP